MQNISFLDLITPNVASTYEEMGWELAPLNHAPSPPPRWQNMVACKFGNRAVLWRKYFMNGCGYGCGCGGHAPPLMIIEGCELAASRFHYTYSPETTHTRYGCS